MVSNINGYILCGERILSIPRRRQQRQKFFFSHFRIISWSGHESWNVKPIYFHEISYWFEFSQNAPRKFISHSGNISSLISWNHNENPRCCAKTFADLFGLRWNNTGVMNDILLEKWKKKWKWTPEIIDSFINYGADWRCSKHISSISSVVKSEKKRLSRKSCASIK